jgi:hypothetical protein
VSRDRDKSEIVSIVIKCGGCDKAVTPESFNFEVDVDERSCPGCDGSYGQMTCLCGGSTYNKELTFQCPECMYYGTIYVD